MKRHGHRLGNMLGAIALMLGAVCLLTVWISQCAGRAAQRGVRAERDDHPLRAVGPARGHAAIEIGKPASRA